MAARSRFSMVILEVPGLPGLPALAESAMLGDGGY